jgi:hypothetical protein
VIHSMREYVDKWDIENMESESELREIEMNQ